MNFALDDADRIAITGASAIAPNADLEQQIDSSFAKRVIVRFTPFEFVSWDHARFGGRH